MKHCVNVGVYFVENDLPDLKSSYAGRFCVAEGSENIDLRTAIRFGYNMLETATCARMPVCVCIMDGRCQVCTMAVFMQSTLAIIQKLTQSGELSDDIKEAVEKMMRFIGDLDVLYATKFPIVTLVLCSMQNGATQKNLFAMLNDERKEKSDG